MIGLILGILFTFTANATPASYGDSVFVVDYNTSTQSAALPAPAGAGGIQKYRIVASTAVNYVVGTNPAAYESTSILLPALTVDYVWVASGDKIAVVKATGSSPGKFFISKVKE
jgi:hypothetical protein